MIMSTSWRVRVLAVAGGCALLVLWWWPGLPWSLPPVCVFRVVWGFPCPGCGMTRAISMVMAGDLTRSLAFHALALPVVLGWGILLTLAVWKGPFRWSGKMGRRMIGVALALVLSYHAVRLTGMAREGTLGQAFRSGMIYRVYAATQGDG